MLNEKLAFPSGIESEPHAGLTRRELLAAMAMQGLLANPEIAEIYTTEDEVWHLNSSDSVAKIALDCADDLIKKLDNKEDLDE